MSFSSALSIALSGLSASQTRAQVTANNIANATTEGYSKQTVDLTARSTGGVGSGVSVNSIDRASSYYLTADRMRTESDYSYASELSTSATTLSTLLGEPGGEDGIFQDYVLFETALEDAAATPESTILLTEVVDRAQSLVKSFHDLTAAADEQRSTADRAIGDAVDTVNTALTRLEEMNLYTDDQLTADIMDERQRLIDTVNENIAVQVQYENNGSLKLQTEGGVFLLDGTANFLEFTETGNVGQSQTLGSPLSGLSVDGIDITPSGGGNQASTSGVIAAQFEIRDVQVPEFQAQIDALAADLINRFSEDSVDPTKTSGEAGLFTDGTSVAPGLTDITGAAANFQLNASVDPDQGGEVYRIRDGLGATTEGAEGNGDQLNRLIDAFTGDYTPPDVMSSSGTGSAAELAAEVASAVAFEESSTSDAALYASTQFELAQTNEIQVTGVDTDTEMQELLKIEQAYAANARVIETVQSMMATLMEVV